MLTLCFPHVLHCSSQHSKGVQVRTTHACTRQHSQALTCFKRHPLHTPHSRSSFVLAMSPGRRARQQVLWLGSAQQVLTVRHWLASHKLSALHQLASNAKFKLKSGVAAVQAAQRFRSAGTTWRSKQSRVRARILDEGVGLTRPSGCSTRNPTSSSLSLSHTLGVHDAARASTGPQRWGRCM